MGPELLNIPFVAPINLSDKIERSLYYKIWMRTGYKLGILFFDDVEAMAYNYLDAGKMLREHVEDLIEECRKDEGYGQPVD